MQTELIRFYRRAFLRHGPRRFAVMQPETADRKYDDHAGALTDAQIAAHLDGRTAYAVPMIEAGLGHLMAFDVDAGGFDAIHALLDAAERRGMSAFGQHDPPTGRGYVWIPFDDLAAAPRVHTLGEQILAEVQRSDWRIENRATEADTRLPFARHRWTGRRGQLLYQDGITADLDTADTAATLEQFASTYRENPASVLPPPPEAAPEARRSAQETRSGPGVTIASYNARTDLAALLESYGARRARGQGARLYFCPFHSDDHASLLLTRDGDRCHCLSQGSECPLGGRQFDAFAVHCIGEGITPTQAIRKLNGREETPQGGSGPTPQGENRHKGPSQQRNDPETSAYTAPARFAALRAAQTRTEAVQAPRSAGDCTGLPKAARRVLEVIRQHASGYIRGKYTLARLLDVDPRTVQRSLRRLEALELIERQERGRDGQTDIYRPTPQDTGGGRHLPPTLKLETNTIPELLEAGKGGQADTPATATGDSQAEGLALPDTDTEGAYTGPGGAVAYPGGAAYVPPEAQAWYSALVFAAQAAAAPEAEPETIAQQTAPELDRPEVARPRRKQAQRPRVQPHPGQLLGRIIAATRKAEKLERGKATERRQARAIRRSIQDLERQLARIRAGLDATGYSPEDCDQWLAEHAAIGEPETAGDTRLPPLTSSLPDASGLIARLRQRAEGGLALV